MSKLPEQWATAILSELIGPGGEFSDGDWIESKDQDPDGSIRLLQLADIGDGAFLDRSSRFVNDEQFERLRCTPVLPGDVLIARMPDPLGRACIAPPSNQKRITVVDVAIARPGPESVSSTWLMHSLNAPQIRRTIRLQASGTTRQRIARGKLAELELPVPPRREQERLANKIDVVLARVDTCRERLDRVPQILKRFREAVLEAAVSGRLTEGWRGSRRADASEWISTTFEAVSEYITVGHVGKMSSEYLPSGVPFLRSLNVRPFRFDPRNLQYVSERFHKSLPKSALQPGDVVIVRSGAPGQCCVMPPELPEANCSDLVILRPAKGLNARYACIYINASVSQNFVRSEQVGVAQAHFNVGSMKKAPLRLPPLSEQAEIVRRVDELLALADALERRYQAAVKRVAKLTPAVLAKAFRGELVPQDPNDEPAEKVLERIRKNKEDGLSEFAHGRSKKAKARAA